MKTKLIIFVLIAGLLTACGSQPATEVPVSPPTEESASPTQTSAPADTVAPPTEAPTEQPTNEPVASNGVSFSNDILPLLQSRCVNCHGGERIEEGLSLNGYAEVMAGSDNGSIVTAGDAVNSLMVELVATQKMPKRGPKLTPPQVQLITDWVNQGALNN